MKPLLWIIVYTFTFHFTGFTQANGDTICILQLNDVYEISPLNQGREGGMARVASIIKQHKTRYQTFVVLAGDFVSPSVIGTTTIDSQRVNGRHMVDIMNKAGVNLVTFGNHEFDIPEKDLQQRINESQFAWISSDVLHKDSNGVSTPFYRTQPDSAAIPLYFTLPSLHNQFTIGIVSATIQSNKQPWVMYHDNPKAIKKAWKKVRKHADITIGLTHLSLAEDEKVLHKVKRLRLIMGGHEHQHNYVTVRKAAIAKADANAKTMYRHLFFRDGNDGKISIVSDLLNVDSTVMADADVEGAVKEWENKAYAAFRKAGLEPDSVVYHTTEPLDGTEASVRYKQTNLGNLIAQSMLVTSPAAQAAVFNSGSIRIDDKIEGVLTQLDIIRTLPFGGRLIEVDLTGSLLNKMLTAGSNKKGAGGYLQLSTNISFDGTNWLINGVAIDPGKIYTIVSLEYLFSGKETGMDALNESNPEIKAIRRFGTGDVHSDIRLAVVKYLSSIDGRLL